MKKICLLLFMSFALIFSTSTLVSAQDLAQELEISEETKDNGMRTMSFTPRVFLDASSQELTISFATRPAALFNVEVEDQNGGVVSLGTLVSNGQAQVYDLSGLSEGYYTFRISNSRKSYTGSFWF